jgi:hypothetical protein
MAKKSDPIHIKPENKGKFRAETHTKAGSNVSEKSIQKAEHSKSPAERKRAVFAENARHWNKKGK